MKKSQIYSWRTGRYCVFKNFVHLVFVTKYRRGVFTEEMLSEMQTILAETCTQMQGELLEFGGEDDHVHLLVSVPPKKALCHFVGRLKGKTSHVLRQKYHHLIKDKLWGKHLWSPSYCVVSCGGGSLEVIKSYISNQRKPTSQKGIKQSLQEKGRTGDLSRVRTHKSGRA